MNSLSNGMLKKALQMQSALHVGVVVYIRALCGMPENAWPMECQACAMPGPCDARHMTKAPSALVHLL